MGTLECEHGKVPSKGDACNICDAKVQEGAAEQRRQDYVAQCLRDYDAGHEVNAYEASARIVRATVGRDLTPGEAKRLRAVVDSHGIRAAWQK